MKLNSILAAFAVGVSTWLTPAAAQADHNLFHFYIGIDNLPTLTSGTYAGLTNPNHNHLTFLYAPTYEGVPSTWHYHSKATLTYSGPKETPTVVRSASNFIPEGATTPPIKLQLGSGIYEGKLVTAPSADASQITAFSSHLTMGSTQSLSGFGSTDGETYLFNSSGGRWNSPFTAADLHFELVSLTPGLTIGGLNALDIALNEPGNDYHLAAGNQNNSFSFTPVLYTDADAAPGVYEAAFKLVDESGTFGESGVVRIRTEVVPEPSTALLLVGGVGLMAARRRRVGLTTA